MMSSGMVASIFEAGAAENKVHATGAASRPPIKASRQPLSPDFAPSSPPAMPLIPAILPFSSASIAAATPRSIPPVSEDQGVKFVQSMAILYSRDQRCEVGGEPVPMPAAWACWSAW